MKKLGLALLALGITSISSTAFATSNNCWKVNKYVKHSTLTDKVEDAVADPATGGFGLPSWAVVVDNTGTVCNVANSGGSGKDAGNSQWLGSRIIAAQKANTSNAFSLDGVAISTGNLYAPTQPGGSLYGLQHSNPVDASRAYRSNPKSYGTSWDQLRGKRIGGVNVFGGGLPLYKDGKKIGAIGVSGDTSCADHANAWHIREALGLGNTGALDFETIRYTTVFAALGDHPACGANDASGTDLGFKPIQPN